MLGNKKKSGNEDGYGWSDPKDSESSGPAVEAVPAAGKGTGDQSTFIGKGSEFVGKLTFEGAVRIDGKIKGEIYSKGTLKIGPGAEIKASIDVDTCQIMGTVNGNVVAARRLEIKKPGRLYGDIRTPELVLEAGVIFEGNCRMEKLEAQKIPESRPPVQSMPESKPSAEPSIRLANQSLPEKGGLLPGK